jgi:type I restriction enzyme S subunit
MNSANHLITDKLEQTIDESLRKVEALRHSILKKAFEDKLVPQDPNDEPAEKLLEWIKRENEKSN